MIPWFKSCPPVGLEPSHTGSPPVWQPREIRGTLFRFRGVECDEVGIRTDYGECLVLAEIENAFHKRGGYGLYADTVLMPTKLLSHVLHHGEMLA